jgi:hypothetical protein
VNIIGSSCGEPSGRGDFIIRGGDVDLDAAGRNVVGDCLGDDVRPEAGRPGSLPVGNRTTGCASGLNASDRLAGPLLDGPGPGPNVSRDDGSRVSELRRARFSFAAMAFSRAAWIPVFDRSPKLVRREERLDAAEALRVRSSCDLRLFDR